MTPLHESPDDSKSEHPDKLLWFVSGNLEPEEARHVESHLSVCAECRSIARTLESWKTGVLRRTESSEHPTPEELDGYCSSAPIQRSAEHARLENHLSECGACREDLAALRRSYELTPPQTSAANAASRIDVERRAAVRRWILAACLAGLLAAPLGWFWLAGRGVDPVLMPSLRGQSEGPVLRGKGPWRAHLVPPSEAGPGRYEMRVERIDGSVVEPMQAQELLTGQERIRIEIPVLTVPGSYRIVLSSAGSVRAAAQLYPFQVESIPGD